MLQVKLFHDRGNKYTWCDIGSSYLPSDILAAFLWAQLEASIESQEARKNIWNRYHRELSDWAERVGVQCPHVPDGCDPAWHIYFLIMRDLDSRERIIAHLRKRGIAAVFHYQPLHASPMGKTFGEARCPVTEWAGDRLVRLPFFNHLSDADQTRIIDAVVDFKP